MIYMRRNMLCVKSEWMRENKDWIEEHKNDKQMVNLAYQTYLDGLCKSGEITQEQWQNATLIYKIYAK